MKGDGPGWWCSALRLAGGGVLKRPSLAALAAAWACDVPGTRQGRLFEAVECSLGLQRCLGVHKFAVGPMSCPCRR